jgi:glycosyltransferase involved in cell wall biosynthesis
MNALSDRPLIFNILNMPNDVLICSSFYPPNFIGGAELVAHGQAKALAALGNNVAVFAGETRPGREHYELWRDRVDGIEVFRVQLANQDFDPDFPTHHHAAVEARFREVLKEKSPSIVHAHNLVGLSAGIIGVARSVHANVILTLHDHWGFCLKNTLMKTERNVCTDYSRCYECRPVLNEGRNRNLAIELRSDYLSEQLSKVDCFVSPSRYLADRYIEAGIDARRMHVLWNGVDLDRFRPRHRRPSGPIRFTYVGYLGEHKGVFTLIEAASLLKPRGRFKVNIVGDGHCRPQMENMVRERRLEKIVQFLGKIPNEDMAKVYADTDVQVLPSLWPENQPVSITEAMASGLPVIASSWGGSRELVQAGVSGFLTEPGGPDSLATAMRRFIEEPDLIQRLGECGLAAIREKSFLNQARALEGLYAGAASDPRRLDAARSPLVVCIGQRMSASCGTAIRLLKRGRSQKAPRFVMKEWLDEEVSREALIAWVVDDEYPLEAVLAEADSLPLLVPSASPSLRSYCVKACCGLYYDGPEAAAGSIEWFLENAAARQQMAENRSKLPQTGLRAMRA